MEEKNIAVIDFGSHAVKCFVYAIYQENVKKIYALKAKTRLAQDLEKTGIIKETSIMATEKLLNEFLVNTEQFNLNEIIAVGTSALRVCNNQTEVTARFSKILNSPLKILSEHEEATLIAKGFVFKNPQIRDAFLIDLGGGSTELAVIKDAKNIFSISIPFGAIRIQDKFLKAIPPTIEDLKLTEEKIIDYLKNNFKTDIVGLKTYGLSGGIKTIFKLYWENNPEHMEMPSGYIESSYDNIKLLSKEQILSIPGMPAERADIALAGLCIVNTIIKYFNITSLHWDSSALKDGLIKANLDKDI